MAVYEGVRPRHQVRTAPTPRFEDLTRHLAAAVHVVDRLADELIDEFLRGPNRAIPASPGVNPVIVLSEAVASRRRRVVRDVFVLVLSAALLVGLWPVSLSWPAAVGAGLLTWTLVRTGQRRTELGRTGPGRVGTGGWVLVVVVASGIGLLTVASTDGPLGRLGGRPAFGSLASVTIGALLLLTAFVDRLYVHGLVRDRFGPGWLRLPAFPAQWPPPKTAWYARRLELIGRMQVINTYVHDGSRMFVGAGRPTHSWSMAVRLRPVDSPPADGTTGRLTPSEIYRAVVNEVLLLRGADGLTPGQRLAGLTHGAVALTSAQALIAHADEPIGAAILPDTSRPPHSYIDPALITGMVDHPLEWIRPYLGFRVAGRQDELVVSTYLHVGCDDNMLYLEWNSYQLDPIRPEYRHELVRVRHALPVVLDAIATTVTVPLSVLDRLRLLVRAVGDVSGVRAAADQLDIGPSFGARRSIREIAADAHTPSYFQDAEGVRYRKLIERSTLAAVEYALRAHGLSTDEFTEQSMAVLAATLIRPVE